MKSTYHLLGLELEDAITTDEDVDDSGGSERSGESGNSEDTSEHLEINLSGGRGKRNVLFFLALKGKVDDNGVLKREQRTSDEEYCE